MDGRSQDEGCVSLGESIPGSAEGGRTLVAPGTDTAARVRGNCTALPQCGHSPSLPVCSGVTGSWCWQCGQGKVIMFTPEAPAEGRAGRNCAFLNIGARPVRPASRHRTAANLAPRALILSPPQRSVKGPPRAVALGGR